MKKLLLTGLSAACFFALGFTASAQNLVVNGNFEDGVIAPWSFSNAVLASTTNDPGAIPAGTFCVRFTTTNAASYATSNKITVTPGHTYGVQFTGRVQTAPGPSSTATATDAVLKLILKNSPDGTTFTIVPTADYTPIQVATTTDQTVSGTYLVPAGITTLSVQMTKTHATLNAIGYGDDISVTDLGVLPIKLTSFTGTATNNGVNLNWATASESNNKSFTVFSSKDGQDFTQIGTVNGAGNSTSVNNYSFTDKNPVNGANYYKLVQTDFDGKTEAFTPISVKFNLASVTALSVYATQTKIQGQLNWVKNEQATVTVTDLGGKTVLTQKVNLQNGVNAIVLGGAGLASSNLYVLTVSGSSATTSVKFYTN
jgi:hypothetical protein